MEHSRIKGLTRHPFNCPGMYVWASAFRDMGKKGAKPRSYMPTYGMMAIAPTQESHERQMGDDFVFGGWFIPCKKNSMSELTWSKARRSENLDFADTKEHAQDLYKERVKEAAKWHRESLDEMCRLLNILSEW